MSRCHCYLVTDLWKKTQTHPLKIFPRLDHTSVAGERVRGTWMATASVEVNCCGATKPSL